MQFDLNQNMLFFQIPNQTNMQQFFNDCNYLDLIGTDFTVKVICEILL